MEVYGDFGPDSFKRLNLSLNEIDKIHDFGLSGVRVDYGYSDNKIADFSHKIKIFLNASTVSEEQVKSLKSLGANFQNIEAWHNFYPRPETGLSKEYLIEKNKLFKNYGMKVSAYVEGDKVKRGPLHLGLPTLEEHRGGSTYHNAVELLYDCNVDNVYVGDIEAEQSTLERMSYLKDNTIILYYNKENTIRSYDDLLNKIYTNRSDEARDVVRAMESRGYASINDINVERDNIKERVKGSITIDNNGYKRYMGEIQIAKRTLVINENVNVIGEIINEDKCLIDFIKGEVKFKLLDKV
nr:MupG family TIM beta-alpha barrel fold protein [Clostridium intestinale]